MNRRFLSKFFTKLFAIIAFSGFFPAVASAEPAKFILSTGFGMQDATLTFDEEGIPVNFNFGLSGLRLSGIFFPTQHIYLSFDSIDLSDESSLTINDADDPTEFTLDYGYKNREIGVGIILGKRINYIEGTGREHRFGLTFSETERSLDATISVGDGLFLQESFPTVSRDAARLDYSFIRGMRGGWTGELGIGVEVDSRNFAEYRNGDIIEDEDDTDSNDTQFRVGLGKALNENLLISGRLTQNNSDNDPGSKGQPSRDGISVINLGIDLIF